MIEDNPEVMPLVVAGLTLYLANRYMESLAEKMPIFHWSLSMRNALSPPRVQKRRRRTYIPGGMYE
jgi:hypothetical protein